MLSQSTPRQADDAHAPAYPHSQRPQPESYTQEGNPAIPRACLLPPPPTALYIHTYAIPVRYIELQTIYEIISLATIVPSEHAFRCIWRAYETVLLFRGIDAASDSKYFKVLINLGGGGTLQDKFGQFLRVRFFQTQDDKTPPSDY